MLQVTFAVPEEQKTGSWFHMFCLHQNRAARGVKNFVPSSALPDFLDLVMWGHEHDCRIEAESENNIFITQPG